MLAFMAFFAQTHKLPVRIPFDVGVLIAQRQLRPAVQMTNMMDDARPCILSPRFAMPALISVLFKYFDPFLSPLRRNIKRINKSPHDTPRLANKKEPRKTLLPKKYLIFFKKYFTSTINCAILYHRKEVNGIEPKEWVGIILGVWANTIATIALVRHIKEKTAGRRKPRKPKRKR
jgi:hypothetical protein